MNLHGIAAPLIGAVNPFIEATLLKSTGYTVNASYEQVPGYAAPEVVRAQVQPLTWRDLEHVDGLNLQGTRRKIYLYGRADGQVRVSEKGGDLVTIASGVNAGTWLVVYVFEQWPDWCAVCCTLQNQ